MGRIRLFRRKGLRREGGEDESHQERKKWRFMGQAGERAEGRLRLSGFWSKILSAEAIIASN